MSKRVRVKRVRDEDNNRPKGIEDSVLKDLRQLGVARQALHTTLPREGRPDLRDLITNQEYLDRDGELLNYYFHPVWSDDQDTYLANMDRANLIYNLFMKECYLAGVSMDIVRIDRAESDSDEEGRYNPFIFTESYVFVPDFSSYDIYNTAYQRNLPFYKIERYLMDCYHEQGLGLALFSTLPPNYRAGLVGWSNYMMAFLNEHSVVIAIEQEPGVV